MTLESLFALFVEHFPDCNVFYDHIDVDEGEELYPPIVLIHEVNGIPLHADNVTYWLGVENRIDVLAPERDVAFREKIMSFLNEVRIPFDVQFDDFDAATMLFTDSYTLTLDED